MGLIAAGTYTTYSAVEKLVDGEANMVAALYRDVSAYPEPLRGQLRGDLEDYVDHVINDAWPAQRRGDVSAIGSTQATRILEHLTSFEPATSGQQALHAEAFSQYNKLIDLRRQRLNAVSDNLPAPLWGVLALGALLNLVLISMIAVDRVAAHLVISGLSAAFVAMMIFLIVAMDNPFLGELSVSPAAFELLRDTLMGR